MTEPFLIAERLVKDYPVSRGFFGRTHSVLHAVDRVSFSVTKGETLCLVGESGCGKSTVARLLMRIVEPSGGRIIIDDTDITRLEKAALRPWRRRVQMVFQDPYSSLNPRLTAAQIVTEPIENFRSLRRSERDQLAASLLEQVGLRPESLHRLPAEFSGGQRQRLGIARALSLGPDMIIADEPVSALDVSVQAQILNLLLELQERTGVALLFISHDLGVVEHIAHRVAVMYLGRIVEIGPSEVIFARPRHPYTEALIAAAPVPDPDREPPKRPIEGEVPSPVNPPGGCYFHPRCPLAIARCRVEEPLLTELPGNQRVACHVRAPA